MNSHSKDSLDSCRAALDARRFDDGQFTRTHARLVTQLGHESGAVWQEVIEAPIDVVWSVVDPADGAYFRLLPNVKAVSALTIGSRHASLYRITRNVAGREEDRIGEVLVEVSGSMIYASDLDPSEPSVAATLPTIYSLTMHEHPTASNRTVVTLAATTLDVYNPWLLPTLKHQCCSIRGAIAGETTSMWRSMQVSTKRAPEWPMGAAAAMH